MSEELYAVAADAAVRAGVPIRHWIGEAIRLRAEQERKLGPHVPYNGRETVAIVGLADDEREPSWAGDVGGLG